VDHPEVEVNRTDERLEDILEELSGNRVNYAWNAIGGVRRDVASDKIPKFQKMLDDMVLEGTIGQGKGFDLGTRVSLEKSGLTRRS
jgi:hypothetical protein